MDTLGGAGLSKRAPMSKHKQTEPKTAGAMAASVTAAPQTKRYDEAFNKMAI